MFSQRSFATTASPYKSAKRGRCYIKISHYANHQIITTDTPIDFHFFRNAFNIALAKDKDRNPVVLQMEAKRNNEVYVSKNSFTTPVFIKEKEDENWKSILVSDGFYLTGTVYVKVDTHEIKMEKIDNYQIPENKPKPATPLKSSVSKQNSSARDIDNQPRIQSPQVIEDSPVKERKPIIRLPEKEAPPKGPKKPVNLWDYFGTILDSDSESPIKKNHPDTTTTKSISQQPRRALQSSDVQEISGKDYRTTTSTSKNDEAFEPSLLNKRREIQDLADFEEKISLDDKHKNKKIKSNADFINLEPENSDIMESEPTKKQVNLNLKKKVIKILDDDDNEEENRQKAPRSKSPRRNKNTLDVVFEEEKMSLKSRDTTKDSESEVIVLQSPRSPSPEANQEDSERTKLKRLKKIVDNRRDTFNKQQQSATKANKDMMLSQEIRNQHGKVETCPICLNDILKDLAKLDSCIHVFCFDCIKDWANVTNECPYCKARFNELSKYAIGEKGEMTKIDSHKVEFKKQVYEEEINYIEEEDVDDCCYECENNDNQNVLLICDECGFHCCHTYCCDPPLDFIPEEDWFCKFCEERRRRPAGRSSSRRNQSGRQTTERSNNNNANQNQRTTRRSARNGGQSLLQRLFSIADRENNNLPDSDLIQEISSNHSVRSATESVDLDETTNQYPTEPSRPTRRLNRLQRNNHAAEDEEEEEEEPVRPRRLQRAASIIGEIEEEFNSNSEELPFSTARARRYASRNNPNQNSTRMNIETNPMSADDLNQFRYSLRSHGRSNTYSRLD